jgi:hypothetical protein
MTRWRARAGALVGMPPLAWGGAGWEDSCWPAVRVLAGEGISMRKNIALSPGEGNFR